MPLSSSNSNIGNNMNATPSPAAPNNVSCLTPPAHTALPIPSLSAIPPSNRRASSASPHQRLVDGRLLSGEEFDKYCERRGLCSSCGVQVTHESSKLHRLLWTKKPRKPLTIRNDEGDYVVYKGYCIQPMCYTLEQAKILLGETAHARPSAVLVRMDRGHGNGDGGGGGGGSSMDLRSGPLDAGDQGGSSRWFEADDHLNNSGSNLDSTSGSSGRSSPPLPSQRMPLGNSNGNSSNNNSSRRSRSSLSPPFEASPVPPQRTVNRSFGAGGSGGRARSGSCNDAPAAVGGNSNLNSNGDASSRRNRSIHNDGTGNSNSNNNASNAGAGGGSYNVPLSTLLDDPVNVCNRGSHYTPTTANSTTMSDSIRTPHSGWSNSKRSQNGTGPQGTLQVSPTPHRSHTLDLTGRRIDEYEIQVLVHSQLRGIKTLILDRCDLGDAGVVALVRWMVQYPPETLKVLCLRWNHIGPLGAKALSMMLVEPAAKSLKTLRLSHNDLGDEGVSFIFQSLQYTDQCHMAEVSLSYNDVGPKGAAIIATSLTEIASLATLSLDHNMLGDEGVQAMVDTLSKNPGVSTLSSISLSQNKIQDVGAIALGEWMASSTTLKKVTVRGNKIGDDGATALVCGLVSSGDRDGNDIVVNGAAGHGGADVGTKQTEKAVLHGLESNLVRDETLIEQVNAWNKTVTPVAAPVTPPPQNSSARRSMPLGFPAPPDLMRMEVPSRGDCGPSASSSRDVPARRAISSSCSNLYDNSDDDMQGRYRNRPSSATRPRRTVSDFGGDDDDGNYDDDDDDDSITGHLFLDDSNHNNHNVNDARNNRQHDTLDGSNPELTGDLLLEIPYENDANGGDNENEDNDDLQQSSSTFYQSASEMLRGMDDSLHISDFLAATSSSQNQVAQQFLSAGRRGNAGQQPLQEVCQ